MISVEDLIALILLNLFFEANIAKSCLEKPVSSSLEQTKKLLSLANKMKTPYKIGYNKTYDEGIEKGKLIFDKLIKDKTFGNLIYLSKDSYLKLLKCMLIKQLLLKQKLMDIK